MKNLIDNTAFVVNFILQLILLIVFLRLAWNVGKIKKHILRDDNELIFNNAEMLEFIGKKQDAIEAYKEYIFKIKRTDLYDGDKSEKIDRATKCIESLGGQI